MVFTLNFGTTLVEAPELSTMVPNKRDEWDGR